MEINSQGAARIYTTRHSLKKSNVYDGPTFFSYLKNQGCMVQRRQKTMLMLIENARRHEAVPVKLYGNVASTTNHDGSPEASRQSIPVGRILSGYDHIEFKKKTRTLRYFTIKESLNIIHKVNYIVGTHSRVSLGTEPASGNLSYKNRISDAWGNDQTLSPIHNRDTENGMRRIKRPLNSERRVQVEHRNPVQWFYWNKLERSPFNLYGSLNTVGPEKGRYQQTIKEGPEIENEYIQIDIWTNGALSPRQALLNAFKKLFELFYNLSKYNCLKPIEI